MSMDGAEFYKNMESFRANQGLDTTMIKYRLDTTEVLRDIELYLRSAKLMLKKASDGTTYEVMEPVGHPLANEEGVQAIIGYLRLQLSSHNVQGNYDRPQYDNFIYEVNRDLAENLMINMIDWGVTDKNYTHIITSMMHTLQMFISRLIDNKERESYGQSLQSRESFAPMSQKKGFFGRIGSMFGG